MMSKKIVIYRCSDCPYLHHDMTTSAVHNFCKVRHLVNNMVFFIDNINEIPKECPLKDNK